MRIDRITLYNFGSYEGENIFDTKVDGNKNIIIIGGKNGAGKTTLFTAMRLCLYGYMSMGYKNANSFYTRNVIKLINNNAKLKKPANASVKMQMALSNGQGLDCYELNRSWILADSLTEKFTINKNGRDLDSDEIADFEKYLLSLIPPELFNLYFFDGEKIADFFMSEGSNGRIKDAFLTLCGYDTFDIMRKNFKRIGATDENAASTLADYICVQDELSKAQRNLGQKENELIECNEAIDACDAEITSLEKQYSNSGGITQEEWDEKVLLLKQEERNRETWNSLIRKWSNEVIPFLMIREQVAAVKSQIEKENSNLKYRNFCEILEHDATKEILSSNELAQKLKDTVFSLFGSDDADILDLSFEQSAMVMVKVNEILDFDKDKIEKCKKSIKKSIARSAKIRAELENSNVTSVREYMQQHAELLSKKNELYNQRMLIEQELLKMREEEAFAKAEFSKIQSVLEGELKKASINDISAKAIVMLDKLQNVLYHRQIEKVEEFFRIEICTLMRKTNFIDDIFIDDEFNVHIYRNETMNRSKLVEMLETNNENQVVSMIGLKGVEAIKTITKSKSLEDAGVQLMLNAYTEIIVPVEIDKNGLSNGEKQIFIMALYHSLVRLCKYEIPFIIDTPFARIDTEHRHNISNYFFSKLNGQVFILSTNEEINASHVQIMQDKILATYMLENADNKRTTIIKNTYFEV